jgi:crotonobetainyl-CoA:carnitine CoA-transferase CaiB-like acyl-CoA transferase
MSTAPGTNDNATLPLAGIKVLDMTRVLAGVSETIVYRIEAIANA